MEALQVDCCNVPANGEQFTAWSGPISDITMTLGTVPTGMNCA